ncbi:kinase-like domain-containing protein [Chaetomium tenue]|uniref:Kinase-like domain-containing protein n=1 Tax=Chaetomium tenue TaxID=1854479 RepID=A0ACB7PFQ2_9PEZI|nr:kinase-like domain-containing protein [Chaetomium globosum]
MVDSKTATLKADSGQPGPIYEDLGPIDAESPEGYVPGGYFPMIINQQFDHGSNLYTIIHKLGFGPSSTVWLAKRENENDETSKVSFHALKILRADLSTPETYPEVETLMKLQQLREESHPGLIHIQESFYLSSPNGTHMCFVLPLLGPSLCDRRVLEAMSCETRQGVCEQLAHAVNYLHEFDICHTNLNPLNENRALPGRVKNPYQQSRNDAFW